MTWRNRNLYLIGLPGAGKSSIGLNLARALEGFGYTFVDLDAEIEQVAGERISEIFRTKGEAHFRELETRALLRIASRNGRHTIVATGGGAVERDINRAIIRGSGIPIWIDVTVRQAAKNVRSDLLQGRDRPLFQAASSEELKKTLSELLEARRKYYEEATLHFVTRSVRGEEPDSEELAQELLIALDKMSLAVALKPPHRTLLAKSAMGNYPILIGSGTAARELSHFILGGQYAHVIIMTDSNVESLHAQDLCVKLKATLGSRASVSSIVTVPGEHHKNVETLLQVLAEMKLGGATRRKSVVVSMGGGVVTDLAGLAANLYHRGLDIVHIPTTLLAQADAAIGGKTGIDAFGGKNTVGTFYAPSLVLVDPIYLKTLARRELHSGLAEVYKYALIGNAELWQKLARRVRRLVRGLDASYEETIYDCIREKLRYVESDEFERSQGVRELLNFGHTFGHAIESATDFSSLLHGEAVLLGMRAAAWLSKELAILSEDAWREIELVLGRIPVEGSLETSPERILGEFLKDKKGKGRVVLLREIGKAMIHEISEPEARRAIEYLFTLA